VYKGLVTWGGVCEKGGETPVTLEAGIDASPTWVYTPSIHPLGKPGNPAAGSYGTRIT